MNLELYVIMDYILQVYSNIENLALWARSEQIGCAVYICRGMMEYWNDGILGLAE